MFLALSPEAVNTGALEKDCRRIQVDFLFLVVFATTRSNRKGERKKKMAKRRCPEPAGRGRGFSANLAKLSRVYQFNCGNTTVISRKELEGKA